MGEGGLGGKHTRVCGVPSSQMCVCAYVRMFGYNDGRTIYYASSCTRWYVYIMLCVCLRMIAKDRTQNCSMGISAAEMVRFLRGAAEAAAGSGL